MTTTSGACLTDHLELLLVLEDGKIRTHRLALKETALLLSD